MKILIVDNNDSFTYNLKQMLELSNACEYDIINSDYLNINEVSRFDKIIISPGPGLPNDFPILKDIITTFFDRIPILGVCLGCQAIAECFGGKLKNLQLPFHGLKRTININSNDLIFKGIGNKMDVGLYHSWAVSEESFPKELEITSKSEDNIIMSIQHNNKLLKGIQFHPESIMTSKGQKLIENWINLEA